MDVVDKAQLIEQLNFEQSIRAHNAAAKYIARPAALGFCLNRECVEPFDVDEADRLFCGPACAERYHKKMQSQ
jgi:hypothetical protein